jgi:translation initiation factor 2B subunit (eIF-2B alpha/beta/delta family)
LKLKNLDKLLMERRRGSTALAMTVLDCFRELARSRISDVRLGPMVERLGGQLSAARPSMPLIARFSHEVLGRFKASASGGDLRETLLEACRAVEEEYRSRLGRLVDLAAKFMEKYEKVLTLSHSGTVERILASSPGVGTVIVLESRPLMEGRLMAKRLSSVKRVELMVDAAVGHAVSRSDACLVGADAIFPQGSFAGKIGVMAMASLAQYLGKPFYVASDLWKITGEPGYHVESGGADEVWKMRGRVHVLNPYFEVVAPYLVTGYLTEEGFKRPSELGSDIYRSANVHG